MQEASPADSPLVAWLHLALTPGIGPVHGRRLLAHVGQADAHHRLSPGALAEALGSEPLARALLSDDAGRDAGIAAALAWQRADPAHHLITQADPRYPARLLHLDDAPLLLYVRGEPACLSRRQLAIVGSRRATALGLATAASLAEALARAGFVVTSGLAEGIDQAAHQGALRAGDGEPARTVAVMGTGADQVYPARHRPLARRIVAGGGALVTELPPGTGPLAANFPRRNRLIAALAEGVLVVEAATSSGSLITARQAADLGREVFAVPGSIHSPQSRGCHRLLRDGATLVETLADVLAQFHDPPRPSTTARPADWVPVADWEPPPAEALGPAKAASSVSHYKKESKNAILRHHYGFEKDVEPLPDPESRAILALLAGGPVDGDSLQAALAWPVERLLAHLQRLELDGLLARDLTGMWFRMR